MPDIPYLIEYALSLTATLKYGLIFVGVIVEGPILMVATGFFWSLGVLELLPLFITLVSGDIIGDTVWYFVGYYFAEPFVLKYGKWFSITPELFAKGKDLFTRYHEKILFISKITIGFGMAVVTLLVAGASRMSFKRYLVINVIGEIILVGVLLSLGYLFGELYNYIEKGFKEFFLIGALIIAGLAVYGFANFMKHKIVK